MDLLVNLGGRDGGKIWVRSKQLKESTKGSEESKTCDDGNMMM